MSEIDGYLKSAKVAQALACSTRWLYELVQQERFPPPDRPATKKGEANLWRASTVKAALDRMQASAERAA